MERAAEVVSIRDASDHQLNELRDEVHLLRQIVRAAGSVLSDDDDFDTLRRRWEEGGRARFNGARAAYYQRFKRSI